MLKDLRDKKTKKSNLVLKPVSFYLGIHTGNTILTNDTFRK